MQLRAGVVKAHACECCGATDPRILVRRTLLGDERTFCANCSSILGRRRITVETLRLEVRPSGDRREADRRGFRDRRDHTVTEALLEDRRAADRRRSQAA